MPAQPLSDLYGALQAADAAGDTDGAQQLADYIRSQPVSASSSVNTAASAAPTQYTITGAKTPNPYPQSPVWGDIRNIAADVPAGVGKLWTDLGLGVEQMALARNPKTVAALQEQAAEKRRLDAPLAATAGGQIGEAVGAAPAALLPGANTALGATAIGGLFGAAQPTVQGESRTANTAIGAGSGLLGNYVGNKFSNWLTTRPQEPFIGWSPATADRALAQSVGSSESSLTQDAIKAAHDRLTGVFRQVRSPSVSTTLGEPSEAALATTAPDNPSARALFESNPNVMDFMDHVTSGKPVTAKALGSISTSLRQDASSQLSSEGGNREVGLALKNLKEHVDDVIGRTIADPSLAEAYASARPQYSVLMDAIDNPTLLNSATGRANATAWGRYLQRNDPLGYSTGANKSPIYEAARWGQKTGEGRGAPPFTFGNLGVPWLGYHAVNNPVAGTIGGAVSRAAAPLAPMLPRGLPGLMYGSVPLATGLLSDAPQ